MYKTNYEKIELCGNQQVVQKRSGLYLLLAVLQDGLGDTIRVSLTEPPEEEIDPCRRLANLGTQAANLQIGVVMHFHVLYFPFILSQYCKSQSLILVLSFKHSLIFLLFILFSQAPFEEKHRHYFDFQRRSGQLPLQKEVG